MTTFPACRDILSGCGYNGGYLLNACTVLGNGGGNTLLGMIGLDLFLGSVTLDPDNWNSTNETFVAR